MDDCCQEHGFPGHHHFRRRFYARHRGGPDWGAFCCCRPMGGHGVEPFGFRRHFVGREERITFLEEYLKELQAEAKAVEEHLTRLRAEE